jgi:hypothetical protein
MSSRRFRRHAPPCLDAAIHRVFDTLTARPALRGAFTRLLTVAHARSDLLRNLPPSRTSRYPQLEALINLARHHREFVADPFTWSGAPGRHPLGIINSLAQHLLGRYPTPRFLASVWFGDDDEVARTRRGWYIEHSRGRRLRDLRLPIALTRAMEHAALHSPDHLSVELALRRAEVIGLGGSPELAAAITATQLGHHFDRGALWRGVLSWLVGCGDEVDLAWVPPIIGHIDAAATPPLLTARPFEAVRRDVALAAELPPRCQPPPQPRSSRSSNWPRSSWREATFTEGDEVWRLIELTTSEQLKIEGRQLRHCVAVYEWRCRDGVSRIWSLRRTCRAARDVAMLTIEVDPRSATVVQLRGLRNQRATGQPLALVRRWAAGEQLRFSANVEQELTAAAAAAAQDPA